MKYAPTKIVIEFYADGFDAATAYGEEILKQYPMGDLDKPVRFAGRKWRCEGFAFGIQGDSRSGSGRITLYPWNER